MPDTDYLPGDISSLIAKFRDARIAVLGDFFLDRYLVIDAALDEPSIETGLTAQQVVEIRNSPGAAGTIVNNLAALDTGTIHVIGVIGDDGNSFELQKALGKLGVADEGLITANDRFTPTYTKPVRREQGSEAELGRLDIINRQPMSELHEALVHKHLRRVLPEVDAVIVLDQVEQENCGVVTAGTRELVAKLATEFPNVVFFADSRRQIGKFENVLIKPNLAEALHATASPQVESPTSEDCAQAALKLQKLTKRPVFLTRGEAGMLLVESESYVYQIPGFPVDGPIDVTGAGDSATAGIILSLCAGASRAQAALVGNLVASITVQQIGTTGTASPSELLAQYQTFVARMN